uniref:Formin-like protein 1 n=1 Tax=Ceratitis capitata TaxID=7213 RepID=W8BDK8_CERCA
MGNSLTHAVNRGSTAFSNHSNNNNIKSRASTTPRNQKSRYHSTLVDGDYDDDYAPPHKSKTLPARHSRRRHEHNTTTNDIHGHGRSKTPPPSAPPNGETSRMLFLLYLIHRTWNVVVETVDTRSKRSRRSAPASERRNKTRSNSLHLYTERELSCSNSDGDCSIHITDLDEPEVASSFCCSQYSYCSCSYCFDANQNVYNSIGEGEDCSLDSICERTFSKCGSDISAYYQQRYAPTIQQQLQQELQEKLPQHKLQHNNRHHQKHSNHLNGYPMAPSVCQNSPKLTAAAAHSATMTTSTTIIGSGGSGGVGGVGAGGIGTTISAPSITQKSNCGGSSINGSMASYKMSSSENSWSQPVFNKENQRPPVYNPEDYVQSLKKFGKRQSGQTVRSIYDNTNETKTNGNNKDENTNHKSSTLPHKHAEYKSPIPTAPESDGEMSLRQFASVTDLLTKLRADLRVSFPSFVQEFVATPSDGISLLLEVLRAIQLSQSSNSAMTPNQMTASMPRNPQSYQRRALLDELACLQCLSICCSRSLDATARLGTTPVGLMPLASSATGQGIRARILAMQLMSAACDKTALGHGSQKSVTAGHTAVSEAMSTLRLRCSEPVRFRLLVGMLNSGGGSGELQAVGVKFINSFLESSESLQQRLYLQAELFQAGFEPGSLAKTISPASSWHENLRNEIKRFHELYVDVDKMIIQAREADRVRSQMVILERRVQILHEEKAVLTSMERRLQERCAELQREIFRLQGAQNENTFKSLDKQPVALPRHVPPGKNESEHEDEGISSSETGPSLSPVPILVLPQKSSASLPSKQQHKSKSKSPDNSMGDSGVATGTTATTIEDVMQELDHVVSEAEKQISSQQLQQQQHQQIKQQLSDSKTTKEKDIVPVNIVPQPPRKSRSLAHLVSQADGSELDGSEYGMLMLQNHGDTGAVERVTALQTFFDETDYDPPEIEKPYSIDSPDIPEVSANTTAYNASTTRELLDVIMNARHSDDDPTMKAFREASNQQQHQHPHQHQHQHQHHHHNNNATTCVSKRQSMSAVAPPPPPPQLAAKKPQAPAQHFNGVFFMTGMNTPQKYPKPDVTAALQARRVTKNVERLEAAFASTSHESLLDGGSAAPLVHQVVREKSRSNQQIYFGSNPAMRLSSGSSGGGAANSGNNVTVVVQQSSNSQGGGALRSRSCAQASKVTDTLSGLY